MSLTTLYRPVGWRELELIRDSDWTEFPPRLAWQPIFYPVLNQAYAEQIARDWNTADEFSGCCGIVTAFDLPTDFVAHYAIQHVGGNGHDELWVPAAELAEFNKNIRGTIRLVSAFTGAGFSKPVDDELFRLLKPLLK